MAARSIGLICPDHNAQQVGGNTWFCASGVSAREGTLQKSGDLSYILATYVALLIIFYANRHCFAAVEIAQSRWLIGAC